jgi:hypothetical protein
MIAFIISPSHTSGAKALGQFAALAAVRAEALTYQSCPFKAMPTSSGPEVAVA